MQPSRGGQSAWYRFLRQEGQRAGVCSILIGRNLPNLWLVNSHRRGTHHLSTAWAAVSARVRRRSTQTRGLDLALAWIATSGQYVSLGQGAAGENRFASTDGSRHAPAPWKTHSTAKLRSAMETFKDYRSEEHTSELQSQSNLVCR